MVTINKSGNKAYYEQLVLSIKEDILQGILQPGDRIPSVREMAKLLLMNPNTVSKAYKVLEAEQVLVTVKGKGTFVRESGELPRNELKIQQLREQLNDLVIEARHLQVTLDELISWVHSAEKKLGGHNK
ncbi:GntR family transcriptional regulator [Candidatus Enterococcus ferrettii]|uniref:GntR family transcriptional regulator n=1 Tax=Candidatus Enterococcus ferrettii TaxID=2815324 RepID=A0ABV0EQS3_9ENTE|nr:GntR family transcriptional regulator [Enterococcus sp. 665A]MBO1341133.1 GntR family transcriptional regulator [Enterococcus sp. 665A]